MKNFQNKAFIFGFCCGILFFIALNFYSLAANHGGCFDCYGDFGVPFTMGDRNIMFLQFIWSGLIGNAVFALLVSGGIGLTFMSVRSKINSRRLS